MEKNGLKFVNFKEPKNQKTLMLLDNNVFCKFFPIVQVMAGWLFEEPHKM